jgi:hypothetical protein
MIAHLEVEACIGSGISKSLDTALRLTAAS